MNSNKKKTIWCDVMKSLKGSSKNLLSGCDLRWSSYREMINRFQ